MVIIVALLSLSISHEEVTPISRQGNKTARYSQSLTVEAGYPKLKEHLGSVVTLMKLSKTYEEFEEFSDRFNPKHEGNILESDMDVDIEELPLTSLALKPCQ